MRKIPEPGVDHAATMAVRGMVEGPLVEINVCSSDMTYMFNLLVSVVSWGQYFLIPVLITLGMVGG